MVRIIGMVAHITKRKRAEEALRASQELLQAIWNNSSACIFIKDQQGHYLDLNPLFVNLTSLPREQILGKTDEEIFPPEQAAAYRANDRQVLEENRPIEFEETAKQKDGIHTSIVQKFPLRDAQRQPYAICGFVTDITERKRSEIALRDSEVRLRMAAQVGKMYAFDWDVATDVIIRSGEANHVFGVTDKPTDLTKHLLLASVHPEDRAAFVNSIVERTPESPDTQISYRLLRPDGSVLWLERTGHASFDEQGKMVRMIGMVADITERKRTEEGLRQKEIELSEAQRLAQIGSWEWDPNTDTVTWSRELYRIAGRDPNLPAVSYKDHAQLYTAESIEQMQRAVEEALRSGTPYELDMEMVHSDGPTTWVRARGEVLRDVTGRIVRLRGTAQDITQSKLAERGLRESEERLRLAAQVGKMYAFDWDMATDVVIRSAESTQILGLTGEQTALTLQQILASVHPEDRATFMSSIAELTPENPNTRISFRLCRPDGSLAWLERIGHALFDKQGRILRMVGMVADITERKLAEEALSKVGGRLIEAHEEERSRIARDLHDDIGQRLALLVNDIDGLKKDLPDSAVQVRNRIQEQLKRVHEIAADVQAMSHRLHSSKLRYLGIVAAAKSFCQELSDQQKVVIDFTHVDVPTAVPEEISLCLFRIMQEALQNAVKHSGVRNFEVELRGAPDGIHLTVRDVGLGFDPAVVMNNRGLGLISMQERVNLVKGTFSIDSRPELGTTIHVRVPLQRGSRSLSAAG